MNGKAQGTRSQYVCGVTYSEYANALADCSECGWLILRHKMQLPVTPGSGPFEPVEAPTSKHASIADQLRDPVLWQHDNTQLRSDAADEIERLSAALINLTVAAKNAAEYLNAKGRRMPALDAAIADAGFASETPGEHS